jgi:hypothetical protein
MTRIGLALAVAAVVGMMGWGATRVGAGNHARAAEPAPTVEATEAADDGNHDEAVHRHRTSQSTHWRHVMVGRR